MSALVLTLLRLGFLALLWIFVFSVVFTLRRDVYGTQVRDRRALVKGRSPRRPRNKPRQPSPHSP